MVPPSSSLAPLEPLLEELCLAARASASAAVVVAAVAVFLRANFKMTEYGVLGSALLVAHEELNHELQQCKCRARIFGSDVSAEEKICTPETTV
jgi:hypothetical protein